MLNELVTEADRFDISIINDSCENVDMSRSSDIVNVRDKCTFHTETTQN